MDQTYFTVGEPQPKKLKNSNVAVALVDETVIHWQRTDFKPPGAGEKVRVAAFDLDETLTTTKSGATFARHGHDWRLLHHMTSTLEALTKEPGRTVVVVFTNQGGVVPQPSAKSYENILTKVGGVLDALPFISMVYGAAKAPSPEKRAKYRKPGSGMFELLKQHLEPGVVDMDTSFYVGDAAGRPQDHSPDDRGFAEGAELKFYTPEEWVEHEEKARKSRSTSERTFSSS